MTAAHFSLEEPAWQTALKNGKEEVSDSIYRRDYQHGIEGVFLPFYDNDAEEEQAQGEFQSGCCEDIE